MRKFLLPLAAGLFVCIFSATAGATANFVYHEQTNNFVATPQCSDGSTNTSCGRYVENTDRSGSPGFQIYSPETYSLHFKVEFQFFTNQVRVYYTTDGSTPCGAFGTVGNVTQPNGVPCGASNTTQVSAGSFTCTYSDQTQGCQVVDVVTASIPPQAAGTTVKYIVSAWHSGGGDEIFADSGACSGCFAATSSSQAAQFDYGVIAPPATPLVISEFRLRGPNGAADEYVEIYNNSDSEVTVNAFDGSAGFALAASDGVTRFTIPNGTKIPGRAHYLGVNSVGYSLGSYPAGTPPTSAVLSALRAPTLSDSPTASAASVKKTLARTSPTRGVRSPGLRVTSDGDTVPSSTAEGDATYTTNIADNAGIALFNTADPANFNLTRRLDAAGSTSELNTVYKEGPGYPAISVSNIEYAFYRDTCGKSGSLTTFGGCSRSTPQDTGDNATDFIFVDTNATDLGAGQRLGAPGPENSTSPVQRNELLPGGVIFPCVSSTSPPNRIRSLTSDPANFSSFGTISFRLRVTNNTGANVTRLRFRVVDITTYPAPGTADLRPRSSSVISPVTNPCGGAPVAIQGTTLEQPPTQSIGGGFNSSLSADTVTLLTPILPGGTYDFQLLVGVEQTGKYKFYVNVEVLP
jgi:hypothetical protein